MCPAGNCLARLLVLASGLCLPCEMVDFWGYALLPDVPQPMADSLSMQQAWDQVEKGHCE